MQKKKLIQMDKEQIFADIKNLINIELTKQDIEKIQSFEQLFKFYNSHTNLVSKNDEQYIYEKHIYDSFALSLFFQKYQLDVNATILDIGTGGGFPSIPLAILYPDLKITPLDSIAKKIGFIEFVQKELRLENLYPLCCRVEDIEQSLKGSFDVVTSRAVASLNTLLEYTIPFVKKDSYFVAFKSKNIDAEIDQAKNAFNVLNCTVVDKINYVLPTDESLTRELVIIKKLDETPSCYPRKMGLPRKKPL